MHITSIMAAGGTGGAGFVVGIVLGGFIGFLLGPVIRSWQAYREWSDASREARLADRLLERMELDADLDEGPRQVDDRVLGSTWRTHP
ncbi:MAG TPA: hypothetical protein VNP90_09300 [Actinomycetota bacterium]|nr:hypothetical protein [Actinomycetota bacterium]